MNEAEETRVYAGKLVFGSNGEEDDILYLTDPDGQPLAEVIADDMLWHGHRLTVRYATADTPIEDEDAMQTMLLETLYGDGEARYGMAYSEITGYLWTDEDIMVGGHDLLAELKAAVGKYCWLEIRYAQGDR